MSSEIWFISAIAEASRACESESAFSLIASNRVCAVSKSSSSVDFLGM
jgi:hypothetical protein